MIAVHGKGKGISKATSKGDKMSPSRTKTIVKGTKDKPALEALVGCEDVMLSLGISMLT